MTGLETVNFNGTVTSIGKSAFYNCTSLQSIPFINITSIGDGAFNGCTSFNNPSFPDKLQTIGASAFAGCKAITTLTIPKNVTYIGTSLQTVNYNSNSCELYDTTSEYYSVFNGDTAVRTVNFGSNVSAVPAYACTNMTGLETVNFNGAVTSIGEKAFLNCTSLSDVYCNVMTENYWNSKVKPNIGSSNDILSDDDVTYHWGTTPVYTVTFDVCGHGTAPATQYVEYGSAATYPRVTATGYTLEGWFTSPGYEARYGFGPVTENITVYAKWKADANTKFTLTYNANGGSGAPGKQTGRGNITLSNTTPTRSGYTFKGWATTSNATSAQYQPGATFNLTKDTTLYAVWKKNNTPDNPSASAKLNVKASATVDYRADVTVTATADNVPSGYYLTVYDGSRKVETGDNKKVSYHAGDMTENKTYTVKVVDANGKVLKDSSGKALSKTVEITVKSGFINKLVAFFLGLFGMLPKVEIKP